MINEIYTSSLHKLQAEYQTKYNLTQSERLLLSDFINYVAIARTKQKYVLGDKNE